MSEVRTLDFDQLFAAVPADRQAALMTAPGVHWDPKRPAGWPAKSYDAPPRTRHFFGLEDLTGRTYGRLTVVGLLRAKPGWSLWLVRCQCGAFEDRTGRGIARQAGPACWRCYLLMRLQAGQEPPEFRKKPKAQKPKDVIEVVLASRAVRRASGMEPRTAMQAALAKMLEGVRK